MTGPRALTTVAEDRPERDAETTVASVRDGLARLDARLSSADGEAMSADERSMLVTLVLSLDEMIRSLERAPTVPAAGANGGEKRRFGPKADAGGSAAAAGAIGLEHEYRQDLARRAAELRHLLDESAGRILIVTGGGGRKRRRWLGPLAFGTVTETAPPADRTIGARVLAALRAAGLTMTIGKVLTFIGAVAALFLLFEFGPTGVLEARDQRALLTEFRAALPTTQLDLPNAAIPSGSAVAIMSIPRIHVDQVVVEGTTTQLMKQGPGHVRGSPLPGEFGNAVVAGHRTTYGAPFRNLNALHARDTITVTTGQGSFTYVVMQVYHIQAGQPDVFGGTPDSRLTLITSDPPYAARGRLAVVATLRGAPVALASRPPVPVGASELGLSADPVGAVLALIWTQLLIVTLWISRRLYRRWNPTVAYLLATPIVVAIVLMMFENLDRLLPGTL